MINNVRNTVMYLLNKENRGYITPAQFNEYAKFAQQNIFNLYFSEYAKLVTARNARRLGDGFGDRIMELNDRISKFTTATTLSKSGLLYPKPSNIFKTIELRYNANSITPIPHYKEAMLDSSNMMAPTATYPVYTERDGGYSVKPTSITGTIELIYVKNPSTPKWTYSLVNSEPIFNASASDYNDFELGEEEFVPLVVEIAKLAGLEIREPDVVNVSNSIDAQNLQKDNS